jgi:glucose-6-phosphate 1-dehydrogenase
MGSDIDEAYGRLMDERQKTVVRAPNAVHLDYYAPILEQSELDEYSAALEKTGLQLSSFNKSGIVYASMEDYTNLVRVVINDELTKTLVVGVATNLLWDVIKEITKKIWHQVVGQKLSHNNGTRVTQKELTFGIDFKLDPNTGIAFRLDGRLTSGSINGALDEAIRQVSLLPINDQYNQPLFAHYDEVAGCWVILDPLAEMRRKHEAQKAKKTAKTRTARQKPKKRPKGKS